MPFRIDPTTQQRIPIDPSSMGGGGVGQGGLLNQYSGFGTDPQLQKILALGALSNPKSAAKYSAVSSLMEPAVSNESLFKAFQPSPTQETDAIKAGYAAESIGKIRGLLFGKGGKNGTYTPEGKAAVSQFPMGDFNILSFPVGRMLMSEQAKLYRDEAKKAYDAITRTQTGAALNLNEQEFYREYVPGPGDSPENAKAKLDSLESLYKQVVKKGQQPLDILFGGLPAVQQRMRSQSQPGISNQGTQQPSGLDAIWGQ